MDLNKIKSFFSNIKINNIISKIKINVLNFFELTRAYALGVTFASCLIILSWAKFSEVFSYFNFFLLVFALCCVHLGANLFDDLIDVCLKLKKGETLETIHFNTFNPKAALIRNKTFSIKQVIIIISVLFALALLAGWYFIYIAGWEVAAYALVGAILVLFYPISSKYCLSELSIGLIYGPLMIMGGYWAVTAEFNQALFTLSLAIFSTALTLLHTHNIMDYEFDIQEGKKTIPILLKDKENSIYALKHLVALPYIIIVLGVILGIFNPKMLLTFIALPIGINLIKSLEDYINIRDVKFQPVWYLGPFENWDNIKKMNIEFYMYRLYLARNFLFFFALFAALGAIL